MSERFYRKRLERGRFASPWRENGQVVRMTASELGAFHRRMRVGRSARAVARGRRTVAARTIKKRTRGIDNRAMEFTVHE